MTVEDHTRDLHSRPIGWDGGRGLDQDGRRTEQATQGGVASPHASAERHFESGEN